MNLSIRQLQTMFWEHYEIRKRHFISTLLEICLPIIIFLLVAIVRSKHSSFMKEYIPTNHPYETTDYELLSIINIVDTKLFYSPKTRFTSDLARKIQLKVNLYNEGVKGFDSHDDVIRYYKDSGDDGIVIYINFGDVGDETPTKLKYDIQIYQEDVDWQTDKLFRYDLVYYPEAGSHQYLGNQFLIFQWALDTCYLEMLTSSSLDISMSSQEFPYPPHLYDNGMNSMFVHILPLSTMLSFIFLIPAVLRILIIEKSSRMKQLMTINGLKSWVYWLAWFFNACIPCLISTVVISILLTQRLFNADYAPLQYVSFLQIFLLIFLYCTATINFIFTLSVFFRDAILAIVTGISIWFLVYFIYTGTIGNVDITPLRLKLFASLIPSIGLYNGFQAISVAEIKGSPVGFTEHPRASSDDMTMQMTLIMLLVDSILYLTIAVCCETDHQGNYKFYTFLSKCTTFFRRSNNRDDMVNVELEPIVLQEQDENEVILEIKDITKKYGDIFALNKLNMQIYNNNLTVILGTNGAGKSTLLSILTGLEKQTSGEVIIKSIENVNFTNRQLISICPQEDMLFPELSVEEHLVFFGKLKGLPDKEIKDNVETLLKELNLCNKRKANISELPSGMKRKLSIGIAILGKPKIIILDEPTASIDSNGRMEIWDIILKYKKDSIIILTTHLMVEAEVLADRIALLADGSLKYYGTPTFLKQKLNVSYRILLYYTVKQQRREIENFIKRNLIAKIKPQIQINKNKFIMEFSILPEEESKIENFLKLLENEKINFSIFNCRIYFNMLTDMYFRSIEKINGKDKPNEDIPQTGDRESATNENQSNSWVKFKLIADKNIKIYRSMIFPWTTMIILSYLLFILTFTMNDSGYRNLSKDGKTLSLSLDSYGITKVYYEMNCNGTDIEYLFTSLVESTSSIPHKVENISETVINVGVNNIVEYKHKLIVGAKIVCDETSEKLEKIMIMYGNQPIHGAPISLNLITNVLVKHFTDVNHEIIASHTPLRSVKHEKQPKDVYLADYIISWVILLSNAFLFSVVMFSALPTLERNSFIKTLSRIYKLNSLHYWLFNYVTDILLYIIIIIPPIMVLGIASTLNLAILQTSGFWCLVGILIWYGITMIPNIYLYSFFQSSVSSAIAVLLIFNMLSSLLVGGMTILLTNSFKLQLFLYIFALIDPHVVLTYILCRFCQTMINNHNWDIKTPYQKEIICNEMPLPCCYPESVECSEERAYIQYPFFLFISTVFAVMLLFTIIVIDGKYLFGKNIIKNPEGNVIFGAEGVQKSYKSGIFGSKSVLTAVKDLSFKASKGYCYGFVGGNGSGKTTSFKILTNQVKPDKGVILKDKHSLIGYCPQQHSLIYSFTGKELLTYFGKLRNPFIDEKIIDELLEKCGLNKFKNMPCGTYSTGNKRKLNICIALIEDPDIIIVDEPTSGLDPESRERIMRILMETKICATSALFFTSHSKRENELLCDKFVIMEEGKVKHDKDYTASELREEYNLGHIAQIKIKTGESFEPILQDLKELLGAVTKESSNNYVLTVSIKNSNWSSIIAALRKVQEIRTDIHNYMVKDSALDGIFLEISKGLNNNNDGKEKI